MKKDRDLVSFRNRPTGAPDRMRPRATKHRLAKSAKAADLCGQIISQMASNLGSAQLLQRLGLDLARPLASHADRLADHFQRPVLAVQQPVAENQDPSLAFRQLI